jgi:hypothetical protein
MSQKTSLSSGGKLYGHLTVTVYEVKNGQRRRVLRMANKNQVTNGGRETVLALLAQDIAGTIQQQNPNYNQIWSLAVGDNPTPVSIGDVSLYSELPPRRVLTIPAEREFIIVPPNIFEIHIHKEIPPGDLTGAHLCEAGLYTRGSTDDPTTSLNQVLYARQIHPEFEKGALMAVEYDWRLGMLVQS